jgi:curved DNA-binding protein
MATATDFKDYYATLGLGKTATPEEIKRAYHKIARKCYPDLNPGDKEAEAKFKDLLDCHDYDHQFSDCCSHDYPTS